MIKVVALRTLFHDKLGTIPRGKTFDAPEKWGKIWLKAGAVERYETKVIRQIPLPNAGEEQQSSALPVAQASQEMTAKPLRPGGKKARKKKAEGSL